MSSGPPFSRLPLELNARIFNSTLVFDPISGQVVPRAHESPLVLTRVCKAWDILVKGIPSLWNSLHFILPPRGTDVHMMKAGLQEWVSRSRPGPIYLFVNCMDSSSQMGHTAVYARAALSVLCEHFARWSSVTLLPHSKPKGLKALPIWPYLMLKDLKIEGCLLESQRAWAKRILCSSLPSLRTLIAWEYDALPNGDVWQHIPWSQLTRLETASGFFPNHCIDVLAQCVNLECCLLVLQGRSGESTRAQPIMLPRLRHLCLMRGSPAALNVLEHVTLPSLIEFHHNAYTPPISTIEAFFERSRCPLVSLMFTRTDISDHGLIKCLRLLSHSLTALWIGPELDAHTPTQITDLLLEKLDLVASGQDVLIPGLTDITFSTERTWISTDGMLAQTLKSRLDESVLRDSVQSARLQNAHFEGYYPTDIQHALDWEMMTDAVDAGLRVTHQMTITQ